MNLRTRSGVLRTCNCRPRTAYRTVPVHTCAHRFLLLAPPTPSKYVRTKRSRVSRRECSKDDLLFIESRLQGSSVLLLSFTSTNRFSACHSRLLLTALCTLHPFHSLLLPATRFSLPPSPYSKSLLSPVFNLTPVFYSPLSAVSNLSLAAVSYRRSLPSPTRYSLLSPAHYSPTRYSLPSFK